MTTNIIQFTKPSSKRLCSFCKVKETSLDKGVKMISNNEEGSAERCICSVCLLKCEQLIKE